MVKAETPRLPGSAGKTRAAQRGWLRWSTTRRREAPSHPTWLGNDRSDLPGGEPACALGVRGLVAHAQKRRRDGGERRRTEASVRAEPPAPNWKLGRCPESHSASSGFPLSSRGRARAIIGVPQGPPGAVHRARPTRRWCRRSGQPRCARQPGPRHTGKPLGGGGVWGERVRCAHMEGIEVGAARGAPIQLGASCFSGRGCAIESGETGGKVKPDTTLGLLAGPPETPERLQGGGALSGGAPPPEAIDLMGMNVAPPEAGNGEGGDASTPWFSGQDARGPARLASMVDDAPTGGAFAPHLVGQRQKRSPRGRACVRAGRPGAGRSRTEAPTRRRRTSSHGGQCPRRTTGAELEARALPREPQRIERLSAIVSGAGACHHWGSAMATWGRASGPPNPPLVPTVRAAALRAAARPAAHRQTVGRRRRLGERVRCAHLEGIEVGAARGAPIGLGASCFSGRGCAIESGEPGGKVKAGTTLGLLAGPPEI